MVLLLWLTNASNSRESQRMGSDWVIGANIGGTISHLTQNAEDGWKLNLKSVHSSDPLGSVLGIGGRCGSFFRLVSTGPNHPYSLDDFTFAFLTKTVFPPQDFGCNRISIDVSNSHWLRSCPSGRKNKLLLSENVLQVTNCTSRYQFPVIVHCMQPNVGGVWIFINGTCRIQTFIMNQFWTSKKRKRPFSLDGSFMVGSRLISIRSKHCHLLSPSSLPRLCTSTDINPAWLDGDKMSDVIMGVVVGTFPKHREIFPTLLMAPAVLQSAQTTLTDVCFWTDHWPLAVIKRSDGTSSSSLSAFAKFLFA